MKWRRNTGIIGLVAFIAFAVWYGFRQQPVLVEGAVATRDLLRATVEEEGKTRVRDRYVVSSPVAGRARRIDLEVGDTVARAQMLVELTPQGSAALDPRSRAEAAARVSASEAALREAEETLRAAVADAEYAADDLERLRKLCDAGTVSEDDLKQAETLARRTAAQRRSAEFAVEVSRFEVEATRTALRHYDIGDSSDYEVIQIVSPVEGEVLKVFHESAGFVSAGQELIEIGDPRALEVEVDVLSSAAVRIRPGMRVVFERWGGDEPLEGRVRVVEPAGFTKISALGVEEQRVLVISDIVSPPERWERLGDGYRVEASFVLWEGKDVLQIPSSALFRHGDGHAVFTVDSARDEAGLQPVRPGHRSGLRVEVVEGLAEGTVVVAHPPDELADGSPVRLRE